MNNQELLSTGSTLLNLACSGSPHGGFLKGKYYFIVGDSASGKTFLSMTCFAEAMANPEFANYRLIYDNIEDGMLMDVDKLFGEKVADRIESPELTKEDEPVYSDTIESFYYHLDDAFNAGKPFIYVLDSMDALDSEAAEKKFQMQKKAARKVKGEGEKVEKVAGSYGDGKAKKNSESLRRAMSRLKESGSILIILCQTRDDIGAMYAGAKTRSGGKSLRFYATTEIWSSIAGAIKKTVNEKERKIGTQVALQIKKNRMTGKLAEVTVDIYPSYGFDDLGSCVDYLVEENFWPIVKNTITATGLQLEGTREKIIRQIEKKGLEAELRELVGKCWADIDEACNLNRKRRYATNDEVIETT